MPSIVWGLDVVWAAADEAVRGSVTGQLSSDIDAKDAVVPQPFGSTKECNCFPVDAEDDSDDEEEDSDADISSGKFQMSQDQVCSACLQVVGTGFCVS